MIMRESTRLVSDNGVRATQARALLDPQKTSGVRLCGEGEETFGDCPLCDSERFFEDEYEYDLEDFMRDFYSETILDPYWRRKDDEQKVITLNKELENYFSEN